MSRLKQCTKKITKSQKKCILLILTNQMVKDIPMKIILLGNKIIKLKLPKMKPIMNFNK